MTTISTTIDKAPLSRLERVLPWLIVIGGALGLIASLFLAYDQIKIWQNPSYQPACNLNPLISCGGVINSGQGKLFGVPGPIYGVIVFPVIATVGMALLAGAKFKRWFWQGLQLGVTGGIVFALWMFWVSLYRIRALCPFCLGVDVVVYVVFWYITLYNLREGNIPTPAPLRRAVDFTLRHHLDILMVWFLILIVYTLWHFWYFFGQYI